MKTNLTGLRPVSEEYMKRALVTLLILLFITTSAQAFQETLSLTKDDAVAYALRNNLSVKQFEAEVSIEAAHRMQVMALPMPEIILHYEGMPDGTRFETWGSRKLFFVQKFDFPTKYISRIRKHTFLKKQAESAYSHAKMSIAAEVKIAYTEVQLAEKLLEVARENDELTGLLLEKAELRFREGEENKKDYLWAKVESDRATNSVTSAESAYRAALEDLRVLLAGPSGNLPEDIKLTDNLEFREVEYGSIRDVSPDHPRLKISENAVCAASSDVRLSYSSFLPDFMVAYMTENNNNTPGFWGARFGMSVPLWFWSDQAGKISEARSALKISEWQQMDERNKLAAELQKSLASVHQSSERVAMFRNSILNDAEQVFTLIEASYREGEAGYTDLLLAQQSMIETRGEYYEAIADYNKSVARFELAAGKQFQ